LIHARASARKPPPSLRSVVFVVVFYAVLFGIIIVGEAIGMLARQPILIYLHSCAHGLGLLFWAWRIARSKRQRQT
jgi:hypothetical protein